MSNNEKKIVMSNEILYILLPDYAAHEAVYLSQAVSSDDFALKENPKYVNKSVAPSLEPVKSIGGFRTFCLSACVILFYHFRYGLSRVFFKKSEIILCFFHAFSEKPGKRRDFGVGEEFPCKKRLTFCNFLDIIIYVKKYLLLSRKEGFG